MRPNMLGRALVALFLMAPVAPAVANSAQNGQTTGFPWWKDPKVVQELKLTPDQSTRIDNIFRSVFPQLRQSKTELDRQEAELSRLLEVNADEATVLRQVDKVEVVRGGLNKARTLMLLHMRKELTSKQNMKFNAVFEQYRRDNPRPTGPPPDAGKPSPDSKGRTPSR